MKKILLLSIAATALTGCSWLKSVWTKEEPVIEKDIKQIEKDISNMDNAPSQLPCEKAPAV